MALIASRTGLFETSPLFLQLKRFRGKINIQKPKPPHFEKAKYLALTKPWFINPKKDKTPLELCANFEVKKKENEENMFEQIISQELYRWFTTSKLIGLCHCNSMKSDQQFKAFVAFKKEKMHFKQYSKKILEKAIKGTPYETILDFYVSENMMIFSPEPEIKKMLKIIRKIPQLILLAGVYENRLISKDQLIHYSTIPTLQAAQSGLVQTLESVGSQIISNLNSHQTTLVSHLQERIKQLESDKS